jgi:hypothetical protein
MRVVWQTRLRHTVVLCADDQVRSRLATVEALLSSLRLPDALDGASSGRESGAPESQMALGKPGAPTDLGASGGERRNAAMGSLVPPGGVAAASEGLAARGAAGASTPEEGAAATRAGSAGERRRSVNGEVVPPPAPDGPPLAALVVALRATAAAAWRSLPSLAGGIRTFSSRSDASNAGQGSTQGAPPGAVKKASADAEVMQATEGLSGSGRRLSSGVPQDTSDGRQGSESAEQSGADRQCSPEDVPPGGGASPWTLGGFWRWLARSTRDDSTAG